VGGGEASSNPLRTVRASLQRLAGIKRIEFFGNYFCPLAHFLCDISSPIHLTYFLWLPATLAASFYVLIGKLFDVARGEQQQKF
jgi:hypothetical protein